MKDLLICVLAMTWVLGLIWYLGRRKHPYERPDHIDRDFRDLVRRVTQKPEQDSAYVFDPMQQETFSNGR